MCLKAPKTNKAAGTILLLLMHPCELPWFMYVSTRMHRGQH